MKKTYLQPAITNIETITVLNYMVSGSVGGQSLLGDGGDSSSNNVTDADVKDNFWGDDEW